MPKAGRYLFIFALFTPDRPDRSLILNVSAGGTRTVLHAGGYQELLYQGIGGTIHPDPISGR